MKVGERLGRQNARPSRSFSILAGVNAHTNLDLAVASAETAPGPAIHSLERDFQQISDLQDAIASVAPLMWLLDIAGGQDDERLVEFSLSKARDAAWLQALVLADLEGAEKEAAIGMADSVVSLIGARVLDPQDVALIIDALR
ncbi:MAG: hypothetical protein EXQ57_10580 [Bryobacterales bacterium]|nr:hypothetical protein [Bryobacterales bacterium]